MCSPLVTRPVLTKKVSGVSRLLNAKLLLALWRRGCHFWRCVSARMATKHERANQDCNVDSCWRPPTPHGVKDDKPALALRDLVHFGCAAYLLSTSVARCCGLRSGGILRTGRLGVTGRPDC